MKIIQTLICYALRHAVGEVAADTAGKAIEILVAHFTDDSQALPKALKSANERTWKALGVAIAGDGFWEHCKRTVGADQTTRNIRSQVEPFLRAAALEQQPKDFREACLTELKRLRGSDSFKVGDFPAADFKLEFKNWQRYGDPRGVIDGACQAVDRVAAALESNLPNLARLLRLRTGDAPPLLASLFAFFLREEIAKNKELSAALTFDLLRHLYAAQETAFAAIGQTLAAIGDKLDTILDELGQIKAVVVESHAMLLDIQAELQRNPGIDVRNLFVEVIARLDRLGMQREVLLVGHSGSIDNEDDRDAVRALFRELRQLPRERQRQIPALLNGLGKLLVGANEAALAHPLFVEAAGSAPGDAACAEIQYNAYRAAVEQRDWDAALTALRQAATFDAPRFTFFPTHRYQVQRILGAGGFGTAFLCHDDHFDRPVVVKTLHEDLMDRSVKEAFNEARAASSLSNPAIIKVYDGDYADPVRKKRPYIVMEYFDSVTLRAYVEKNGELSPEKYGVVARQIVAGMTAAHRQGVWHRDLKPDNILINDQLGVKIIDFGLALRRQVVETSGKQAGAQTVLACSAAGTLAYSAPEQMGRIAGVQVGPYSDVFAFGKTSWFALFNLESPASPTSRHRTRISGQLVQLLEKCTEYHPKDRYPDFAPVWQYVRGVADDANRKKRQAESERERRELAEEEATNRKRLAEAEKIAWTEKLAAEEAAKRNRCSAGENRRQEQEAAEHRLREEQERQTEGEKQLVDALHDQLEKSGGKLVGWERSGADAICHEYGIPVERAKKITQQTVELWQKAHPLAADDANHKKRQAESEREQREVAEEEAAKRKRAAEDELTTRKRQLEAVALRHKQEAIERRCQEEQERKQRELAQQEGIKHNLHLDAVEQRHEQHVKKERSTQKSAMLLLCPNCKKHLTVPNNYAGQLMKCGHCQGTFVVPSLEKDKGPVLQPVLQEIKESHSSEEQVRQQPEPAELALVRHSANRNYIKVATAYAFDGAVIVGVLGLLTGTVGWIASLLVLGTSVFCWLVLSIIGLVMLKFGKPKAAGCVN